MSEEYDNKNRGALFKNKRKKTQKQPDYTGNLNVEGEEYWVAAWLKKSKKGETFMSLSIQSKEEENSSQEPERKAEDHPQTPPDDDDIPF